MELMDEYNPTVQRLKANYAKTVKAHIAKVESLQATVQEQAAEIALLKQVEANLCELHNVALAEIERLKVESRDACFGLNEYYELKLTDSQHKVKVLSDALECIANGTAGNPWQVGVAKEALATVKELK